MGTNYYMMKRCGECDSEKKVHLGKSSMGWAFTFRGDREAGVVDFNTWAVRVLTLAGEGYDLVNDNSGGWDNDSLTGFMDMAKTKEGKKHAEEHPSEKDWVASGCSFTDAEFC